MKERPFLGEIEEAMAHPNGSVFRIFGDYRDDEAVPPQDIVGAWKVNAEGKIVGEFIPNPNFDPSRLRKS